MAESAMTTETATSMRPPEFRSDIATALERIALPGDNPGDTTLAIPQSVFDALPSLLSDPSSYFAKGFERDIFLTSALIVCSGILSNAKFRHRDKWYHLNLYGLITADAGSGKGDAGLAWELAKAIDTRLFEHSKAEVAEWENKREEIESIKFRNRKRKKGEEPEVLPELPTKPSIQTLRIAVNSSSRAFVDRLEANRGAGIVLDTEIKTLLLTRKQEWGDTEAYLKGFHNEPINIDRAGGISVRIEEPCFAACLTGTPEALRHLISSVEDGLFSRFIHYRFKAPDEWRSHRPMPRDEDRDQAIARSAHSLDSLHRLLAGSNELLHVRFSENQWDRIDRAFADSLAAFVASGSERLLHANVRRAGLIAERIACILAILRQFENGSMAENESIGVGMADVEAGIALAQTYLCHAIEIAKTLRTSADAHLTGTELRIFTAITDEPVTSKDIASNTGLSIRGVQQHLKSMQEKGLIQALSDKGPYARSQPIAHCASRAFCAFDEFQEPEEVKTQNTQNTQCAIIEKEYQMGDPAF
jgi:Protein of unknown function (DUF3987)/Winged helix-turn-helix DNA-binding